MIPDFTIQQIADAANLTRYQVEAWISRGHFTPRNPVENGKARKFTSEDAVTLAALAEFNRLGLNPAVVSMQTAQVRFRAGRGSLFVIVSIIRQVKANKAYPELSGEIDLTKGDIVEPADFARIMDDPQVRAVAAVNIVQIEQRVRASLGIA
jgi:DNA-binding transcriptional MerR regulator